MSKPNPFGAKAIIRSAAIITGSTYFNYALGLVISTLIARSLGPADYGRYSYVVWLSGILVVLANNGLTTTGIRFVSEYLGRGQDKVASDIHGWLARRHYVSSLAVAVGFLAVYWWLEIDGGQVPVWVVVTVVLVSAITKADYLMSVSVAKGHGAFSVEPLVASSMMLLTLVCVLVLVWARQPVSAYLLLFLAVSVFHAVMARVLASTSGIRASHDPLDGEVLGRMRKHLGWTILLTFAVAFSNKSVETFLLNRWIGPEAVGFFIIAATLTRGGIDLLSSGLNFVLMPMMGNAYGAGGLPRMMPILASAIRYFWAMGLVMAGVGVLWAAPVVLTMYGDRYAPVIVLFQGMALVGGLTLLEGALGAALSTSDNQRLRVVSIAVYLGLTVALAVMLIPGHGLMGALWAHMISRLAATLLVLLLTTRMLGVSLPVSQLARLLLSAVAAALVAGLMVLPGWGGLPLWFIAGFVYAGVFAAASMLLRVWTADDMRIARSLAAQMPVLRRFFHDPSR